MYWKTTRYIFFTIALLIVHCSVLSVAESADEQNHSQKHPHHSFEDIEKWITLFEDPKRHEWQKPDGVVKALNINAGDVIADIGAGTGYFTRLFALAVGPQGRAFGLDTEPTMIEYMKKDAKERNLKNYIPLIVAPDNPGLDAESIDIIFICNTLHHIDDRINYMKKLAPSLKPGGRIVIIDFYKKPLPVGPPPGMKLKKVDVIEELKSAGYHLKKTHDLLPYQYFLEFSL